MALRNIVTEGDDTLRKVCRPVGEINDRIQTIIDDMIDTMNEAEGVGIAAPQVGILRRIFVVDIGEGPIVLINPEILETSGEQEGPEGCLSVPGKGGHVVRPNYVKIKGLDREGNEVVHEGTELLARAFLHENDHLDGVLYIDKADEIWEVSDEDYED